MAAAVPTQPPAAETSPKRLVLLAALVTLGVTLLRVWGELSGWTPILFSNAPGGGAALVGITWLVPVFGAWFALRLPRAGVRAARVLGASALALVVIVAVNLLVAAIKKEQSHTGVLGVFAVSSVLGLLVGLMAWPALGRTLLLYGLAARVPVVLLTLAAIRGGWRTHYDAPPPGFPPMASGALWFWIGILPQLTIWLAFTVVVGTLAGGVALLVAERRAGTRPRRAARPAPRVAAAPVAAAPARRASPSPGGAAPLREGASQPRPPGGAAGAPGPAEPRPRPAGAGPAPAGGPPTPSGLRRPGPRRD